MEACVYERKDIAHQKQETRNLFLDNHTAFCETSVCLYREASLLSLTGSHCLPFDARVFVSLLSVLWTEKATTEKRERERENKPETDEGNGLWWTEIVFVVDSFTLFCVLFPHLVLFSCWWWCLWHRESYTRHDVCILHILVILSVPSVSLDTWNDERYNVSITLSKEGKERFSNAFKTCLQTSNTVYNVKFLCLSFACPIFTKSVHLFQEKEFKHKEVKDQPLGDFKFIRLLLTDEKPKQIKRWCFW